MIFGLFFRSGHYPGKREFDLVRILNLEEIIEKDLIENSNMILISLSKIELKFPL